MGKKLLAMELKITGGELKIEHAYFPVIKETAQNFKISTSDSKGFNSLLVGCRSQIRKEEIGQMVHTGFDRGRDDGSCAHLRLSVWVVVDKESEGNEALLNGNLIHMAIDVIDRRKESLAEMLTALREGVK